MKVKVIKTISYGGVLYVKCIGINMDYTMSISLLILKLLAADSMKITKGVTYVVTHRLKMCEMLESINAYRATV